MENGLTEHHSLLVCGQGESGHPGGKSFFCQVNSYKKRPCVVE